MKVALIFSVFFFFFAWSHAFSIDEIFIAGLVGCPCLDEIACGVANDTELTCVKLFNAEACQTLNPSGVAECVPCVNAGFQWCPMNFSETNSALCAKDCTPYKNRYPNLFNGSEPITCTDFCPNELLCPDCVSDDQTEVKVVICHKPGTPAEKTLKVPPQDLQDHIGHGDTIGPCGKHHGHGNGDDDDDGQGHHNYEGIGNDVAGSPLPDHRFPMANNSNVMTSSWILLILALAMLFSSC